MKTVRPGQLVYWRDSASIVLELKGLIEAVIRRIEDSSIEVVRCADLKSSPEVGLTRDSSHLIQGRAAWDETLERFAIIKPLLQGASECGRCQECCGSLRKECSHHL